MKGFKTFLKRIDVSLYDALGRVSHTKISSYIMLIGIYISSLTFLLIDIINAIITWKGGSIYEVPATHIGIFTLLLSHHLALLGIKKNSENKVISSVVESNSVMEDVIPNMSTKDDEVTDSKSEEDSI